jgi:hypothetical protein
MSRESFRLLLSLMVVGCAAKNTVAGRDKTKAEQLEAALPSWCQTTCARIEACPPPACDCQDATCNCNRAPQDCRAKCEREMMRFIAGDDTCATIGQTYERCVDSMTCDDFDHNGDCVLSQTDESLCPAIDDSTEDSAAEDGPTASVLCSLGYDRNLDGNEADAVAIGVICDEGRRECEDGHAYAWLCARGSEGSFGCTCFVDSEVTGGFAPGSSSCPDQGAVNAACHWNIALVSL